MANKQNLGALAISTRLRDIDWELMREVWFSIALFGILCAMLHLLERKTTAIAGTMIAFSGYILLVCLERILPNAGPRKSARRWWMHMQIHLASTIAGIALGGFLVSKLSSFAASHLGVDLGFIDLRLDKAPGVAGLIAASLAGVFVGDFFYYWFHRAFHASSILWQHHKMHHMDPEFDTLTANRNNWMESVFLAIMVSLPATILFKFDQTSYVDVGIINGGVLYVLMMLRHINHSNLRIQFGKASFLWVSSQTHRIHHSLLPEHRDKNFAAHFPLWDVIFGTYYAPKWDEFPPTGVEGEREIKSFWEAQVFTFREWWKMFRSWLLNRRATFD